MRPFLAYQSLTSSSPKGVSRLIRRTCTWASRARFDASEPQTQCLSRRPRSSVEPRREDARASPRVFLRSGAGFSGSETNSRFR
eukprot:3391406-Prymnesium_polylepis.2